MANTHLSYSDWATVTGEEGLTNWVKYNWLGGDAPTPQPLTSYDDIIVGNKYHVVIPAGVAFNDPAEFVLGNIINVTPEDAITTRMGGLFEVGFGNSNGETIFNVLVSRDEQKGIAQNVAVEFDITVTSVVAFSNTDKLYQYMYEVII